MYCSGLKYMYIAWKYGSQHSTNSDHLASLIHLHSPPYRPMGHITHQSHSSDHKGLTKLSLYIYLYKNLPSWFGEDDLKVWNALHVRHLTMEKGCGPSFFAHQETLCVIPSLHWIIFLIISPWRRMIKIWFPIM